MNAFIDAVDKSSSEIEKLQKLFKKSITKQINAKDEKSILKAVAITWFQTHRPALVTFVIPGLVTHIDKSYQELLNCAEKSSLRKKCQSLFKQIRSDLHILRSENIVSVVSPSSTIIGSIPSFSNLVSDPAMQQILASRWDECTKCVEHNAPLAAVVMMGGLLETLLLSKINAMPSPTPVYTAKLAPKNPQGQTLPLKDWGLRNYIEVAHELKWITQTEKDLGAVLMDYRNYIHPFKQKAYGIFLQPSDARILWGLCKSIAKQLI